MASIDMNFPQVKLTGLAAILRRVAARIPCRADAQVIRTGKMPDSAGTATDLYIRSLSR